MGVLTSIVLTEVVRADGPNVGDERTKSLQNPADLPPNDLVSPII